MLTDKTKQTPRPPRKYRRFRLGIFCLMGLLCIISTGEIGAQDHESPGGGTLEWLELASETSAELVARFEAVESTAPLPPASDSLRVNFQFDGVILWQAVRAVAHAFQKTFVASDSLKAVVHQSLYNADLFEALDALLLPSGYVYWLENQVIQIRRAGEELQRLFPLKRARAERIWPMFQKIMSDVSGYADSLRNVILLVGPAAKVLELETMLETLDVERPDILIQAEIIELSDGLSRNLGVQWQGRESIGNYTLSGQSSLFQQQLKAVLQLGYLNGAQLTALLEAVDENRDARILSRPRIVATSGEPASILAGERVPYTSVSQETPAGGFLQQVDFVDVGIKLNIVAHVVDGGRRVMLEVHPEVSEVLDKTVQGVPRIGTREAHTKITVDDGMTAVIGGLTRERQTAIETGVPVLRSIPGLGWLFKRRSMETTRTELLVLITPKILTPDRRRELLRERENFGR